MHFQNMKIKVDKEKCISALPCLAIAPKTFKLDAEKKAYVSDPEGHDYETVLLAARSCPVKAIFIYDDDGNEVFPGTEYDKEDKSFD